MAIGEGEGTQTDKGHGPLIAPLEERRQVTKGFVRGRLGGGGRGPAAGTASGEGGQVFLVPLVLIVVAIEAEEFPVAAVRRVVVVIHVLMVNRQLPQIFVAEVAATPTTDPGVELEGLIAVAQSALIAGLAGRGHDLVKLTKVNLLAREGMSGVTGVGHGILRAKLNG
jgi:hypothetical protein